MEENKKYWFLVRKNKQKSEIVYCAYGDEAINIHRTGGSCSPRYDSEEELIKGQNILEERCRICGDYVSAHFIEPLNSELIKENICFECHHWSRIEKTLSDKRRFIIDNNSYWQENDNPNAAFQGHGGSLFRIKRFDSDDIIPTRNLWHQGEIPEHWRERIPNNAIFIRNEQTSIKEIRL
jgi:hypothetical protein